MGDIKPVSFRIDEEDQAKFKEFATENGINQADAFASLLGMLELEKAKNTLGDRAKGIDSFKETVTKLVNFYLNALEENATTEDRIREELSKEIKVKEDTILNIMEQLKELKEGEGVLKGTLKDTEDTNNRLQEQLNKANADIEDKQKQLDIANRNNNNLQEQIAEYKQYRDINKQLEKELQELKQVNADKDKNIAELSNKNTQLEDKIKNDMEMLEFYKTNNIELKDNIKALEEKNTKEILNIKEEHRNTLEEQIKTIEDNLNAKHSVELQKKDIEIEMSKNTIEQLQQHKPATRRTKQNN